MVEMDVASELESSESNSIEFENNDRDTQMEQSFSSGRKNYQSAQKTPTKNNMKDTMTLEDILNA